MNRIRLRGTVLGLSRGVIENLLDSGTLGGFRTVCECCYNSEAVCFRCRGSNGAGCRRAWTSAPLAVLLPARSAHFLQRTTAPSLSGRRPSSQTCLFPRFTPLSVSRVQLIASALPDIIIPHKLQWINHWNRSLAQKSICGKNKATLPSFEWTIIGGENVKSKRQYRGNDAVLDRTLMKCNYGLFA